MVLFNDVISSSGYAASNGRMISERWIGKGVERSTYGLIYGTILGLHLKNQSVIQARNHQ
jgi:hypothetical protein